MLQRVVRDGGEREQRREAEEGAIGERSVEELELQRSRVAAEEASGELQGVRHGREGQGLAQEEPPLAQGPLLQSRLWLVVPEDNEKLDFWLFEFGVVFLGL